MKMLGFALLAVTFTLCLFCMESRTEPIGPPVVDVQGALLPEEDGILALDDIGLFSVGYALRGQQEKLLPIGWSGGFDSEIGIACRPMGEQQGKRAFLLHCPWIHGTGITFQEFSLRLPQAQRVLLRGATAILSESVEKSDGATFRVYVDGRKVMEVHRADDAWQSFEFDLTRFIKKTVLVRFETDPGPKDNPGWDHSLWGNRELVLKGFKPKPVRHPEPPPLNLTRLWSAQSGTVAPRSGFSGSSSTRLEAGIAVFHDQDPDGDLEYRWHLPQPGDPLFGRIVLKARQHGGKLYEVPLATAARLEWDTPAQALKAKWDVEEGAISCLRSFKLGEQEAMLSIKGRMSGKSLLLDVACDRPLVRMLDAGSWGPVQRQRQVTVPYYSGVIRYLPVENLFVNALLDWTNSSASNQEGMQASYQPLTDGTRNLLHDRAIFTAAWHMAEVLPNIPNEPSRFHDKIGDRIVLDIWGGGFTHIADDFKTLVDYGIDKCVALIHNWQRSGYDNALPMHYPAAQNLGGDEGMKTLVETGKQLDYLVALHENYVDYYPNYDFFNEQDIALNADGSRMTAWYNPGTKIQSFAVKPNAIMRLAESQSPEIHRRYGANACYLDVHSAVPPWFHVDARAGEEGAGTFRQVWDIHQQLWKYERLTYAGPVFGEGNNHWYWSGALDGVEAQFGVGWPWAQGMSAPLMVDFDLLKIHPVQFNHGMGYYERWWDKVNWSAVPPMVVLDQYRMQEVAYGHAGFLSGTTWNVLPLAWLEHHLLTPVTARYASAKPVEISYRIRNHWVDGTHAAKAREWDQVRVRYDSGLTVVANNARNPLKVGKHLLPQFGWLAEGAGVTAYTAMQEGIMVDYAETTDNIFANARPATDWALITIRRIKPRVSSFQQTGTRTFEANYEWAVQEQLTGDFHCFVHFDNVKGAPGGIAFQQDHALPIHTSKWQPGKTVSDGPYTVRLPEKLPDGDYAWFIGLYTQEVGRLPLLGVDDGTSRIRLGVLHIQKAGTQIEFDPERSDGEERVGMYQQHVNTAGKLVDFGTVRTDGSILVRRENREWLLRTLPRERDFVVEFNVKRFPMPDKIRCIGGKQDYVTPVRRGQWWRLPLNGARQYRWL